MVNKPTTHQASVYKKISTDPFSSKSQTDITQNMESAQESLIHMYNQIMEELTICILDKTQDARKVRTRDSFQLQPYQKACLFSWISVHSSFKSNDT
jgi:fructose-1,6-bisphosphatase/sedoheptulose 1,7-bisphosphatase-like protein